MDAMQVLAHQTAMGYRDSLREALPEAPVKASRDGARVRRRLAVALRSTADRLDPVTAC
ncbi:hypothetical protein HTZ77_34895 [Nonomuraea sp. SMC257]|uniref:Uncharacterized protein n=1 Tax=Nonomuraea montanisoli TaxID=2741721 RepID=A0A7Y6M6K8_9ACTN|nr:hypothetical protein [Nonomuraea montanisoli]NUW36557.1 hypothetical protein [Nonomuraea montanisoli]